MSKLLADLHSTDTQGLFVPTETSVSYPTGFPPFDAKNGFLVQVRDLNEKLITTYPSRGLVGGRFTTIVGKSGTAKTTFAAQVSAHIIKTYEDGFVMHYDLEQALDYTRLKNITNLSQRDLFERYILKQERCSIDNIFTSIKKIAQTKESRRKELMYDTGLLNEFGRPIIVFPPTFIIVDSIPSLFSDEITKDITSKEALEMEGATVSTRMARIISGWYRGLMPIIKLYNINIIMINHIKTKIEINPIYAWGNVA